MTQGSYKIWTLDRVGAFVGDPTNPNEVPNPTDPKAWDIYYGLPPDSPQPPPKDQSELQERIQKVLRSVQQLYKTFDQEKKDRASIQFRNYYVRLFKLAQLGLEGANVATEIASSALTSLTAELIDDEAGRVKNAHLQTLGWHALGAAVPFAICYLILKQTGSNGTVAHLMSMLDIKRELMANFMLLWIGCFLGVWLSYGIRTASFTLSDLTITDGDRLSPTIRLVFAGTLTMILGIVFAYPILEIKIGDVPITNFKIQPMLAFLVGCFCGISELVLPTTVAKRASDFISNIK